MTDPVIRLDTSKPFSECRGERTPDDPHYRVHSWQGTKIKGIHVLLPFDANGLLVPDDGKTEPYDGINVENKPVKHHPLYTKAMRELVELKKKKLTGAAKAAEPEIEEPDDEDTDAGNPADDVNFVSWLRGEAQYEWIALQAAAKKRYSRNFANKKSMVEDLVLDEKVVPEDQVCRELAKYLPARAA